MSGQSGTEEKNLPATPRKLRDARKKGQAPSSQDFVTGTAIAIVVTYLWVRWDPMDRALRRMLSLPDVAATLDFRTALNLVFPPLLETVATILGPILVLNVAAAILSNLIVKQGIPISIDPILPRFDRINPVNGFKRLFGLKNFLNLVKSVFKAGLLFVVLALSMRGGLNALLQAPACGLSCVTASAASVLKPLTIAAALLFVTVGILDIGLQRWLFLRDLRMSRSDRKREYREQEGEPLFKRARRRQHQEASLRTVKLGIEQSTVLVVDAAGTIAIGIRFVRGETAVPIVVCKLQDAQVAEAQRRAATRRIPVLVEEDLVAELARQTTAGGAVPEALFTPVAGVLVKIGAV